jgi:hypothetical protein
MEMVGGIALSFGLFVLAGLLPWVGRAGANGSLPRNDSTGIRTKWTTASPEAWTAGHHAASPLLLAAGIIAGTLGLLAIVLQALLSARFGMAPALITGGAGYAIAVGLVLVGRARANRAAQATLTATPAD